MNDNSKKINIEQLLANGQTVRFMPMGYSMFPMIVPGRDEVIVSPCNTDELKRGDVALYRKPHAELVLHRIMKREGNSFYFAGDRLETIEGPISQEQIRGILVAFIRKGKEISVKNTFYIIISHIWMCLFPIRSSFRRIYRLIISLVNNLTLKR